VIIGRQPAVLSGVLDRHRNLYAKTVAFKAGPHHANTEVEKAYGKRFASDADRIAFLFKRYAELIANEKQVKS
jgi:hypothetical protein